MIVCLIYKDPLSIFLHRFMICVDLIVTFYTIVYDYISTCSMIVKDNINSWTHCPPSRKVGWQCDPWLSVLKSRFWLSYNTKHDTFWL
jgi:hypothetical protein